MIELTPAALTAVRTAIERSTAPVDGLRIMVRSGGCAGLRYVMGLEAESHDGDIVVDRPGVRLYVDADSRSLVDGLVVDFVEGLETSGFVFDNPNARAACSCGKSFC
jgi:iron-sulfur cluster assembly accessory protein